ncbi:MAG TPA: hypothetical protein VMV31_11540 [Terriglobales bacterium]|nr:hypothetical protein [Terriglobales bacterium]
MVRIEPVQQPHKRRFDPGPGRPGPRAVAHGIRVGRPQVHLDTPSHTAGTQRGEEVIRRAPEKGHAGMAREARSATSINPEQRGPVDVRMPHLPPS